MTTDIKDSIVEAVRDGLVQAGPKLAHIVTDVEAAKDMSAIHKAVYTDFGVTAPKPPIPEAAEIAAKVEAKFHSVINARGVRPMILPTKPLKELSSPELTAYYIARAAAGELSHSSWEDIKFTEEDHPINNLSYRQHLLIDRAVAAYSKDRVQHVQDQINAMDKDGHREAMLAEAYKHIAQKKRLNAFRLIGALGSGYDKKPLSKVVKDIRDLQFAEEWIKANEQVFDDLV